MILGLVAALGMNFFNTLEQLVTPFVPRPPLLKLTPGYMFDDDVNILVYVGRQKRTKGTKIPCPKGMKRCLF